MDWSIQLLLKIILSLKIQQVANLRLNVPLNAPVFSPDLSFAFHDYLANKIAKDESLITFISGSDISPNVSEKLISQYASGKDSEDVHLNIEELIRKYGFEVEKHEVQTEDGYVLTMFRIPNPSAKVVFLMHGLLSSADDWVSPGPERGLALLLAAEGYDVWLGNARGNKHSRRHIRLSPDADAAAFWDFSWDEIGRHDLPAMIDNALAVSRSSSLIYVGHSQGTTAFFVLCSERPEYNDKVSLMVALSAVAWMSHVKSPIIKSLSPYNPFLYLVTKAFGAHEFLPNGGTVKIFKSVLCGNAVLADLVCSNLIFLLCGFNYDQVNFTRLPVIMSNVPAGAAMKQLVHYAQGIVSGNFQKFDYGSSLNLKRYGSKSPPPYSVERIKTPIAILYSYGDWLASPKDVQTLHNNLVNVVDFYKIPLEKFNHVDFIWAKDIKKLVFHKLLLLLKSVD